MIVRIDFDDGEPPGGWVATASGDARFDGWLSLLQLLEHALEAWVDGDR